MFDDPDNLWGAAFAPQASEVRKYRPDQRRDAHGRFAAESGDALASAADALESTVTPHDDSEMRGSFRAFAHRAIHALHERATALARAVKQPILSTRLVGVNPVTGGGVEVQTAHELPNGEAHIRAYAQVYPHNVRHPTAQKLLSAAHHTLLVAGRRYVSPKHPPIGATFKNGTP